MAYLNDITVSYNGDSGTTDAFGRLRVGEPYSLFSHKDVSGFASTLYWHTTAIGTGATTTWNSSGAEWVLGVGTPGSYCVSQTYDRVNYQPGKSQLIFFTGLFQPEAGTIKRAGLFYVTTAAPHTTPRNGIYFETSGTNAYWKIATGGAVTEIAPQSAWNVDKLDGTGSSGITLNLSAVQIGLIDFEWLGVGTVRTGFIIDGSYHYCHKFHHANQAGNTAVYMNTPLLPLCYYIESTGGTGIVKRICSSIVSEGGINPSSTVYGWDTGAAAAEGIAFNNANRTVLAAMRLRENKPGAHIEIESIELLTTSSASYRWSLILNPTFAGTTLTYNVSTGHNVEIAKGDVAGGTTASGGTILQVGYVSNLVGYVSYPLKPDSTRLGVSIDGTKDVIALCVTQAGATAAETFYAAIQWREYT